MPCLLCFASFHPDSQALDEMERERQSAVGESRGPARFDWQARYPINRERSPWFAAAGAARGRCNAAKKANNWVSSVSGVEVTAVREKGSKTTHSQKKTGLVWNTTYYEKWICLKNAWISSFFRWIINYFFAQNSFSFWLHHSSSAALHWNVRWSQPGRVWKPV